MSTPLTLRAPPPFSLALGPAPRCWSFTRHMASGAQRWRRRLRIGGVGAVVSVLSAAVTTPHAPVPALTSALTADAVAPCVLPLPAARVVSLARIPLEPWQPGHRGIDVATRVGDEVVAPADATVEYVGVVVDRPVITLRHAGGLRTSLEPVETTLGVGDAVARGTPVGTVSSASGHCAPDTCVHWGMRQGDEYVDPLSCVPGFGPVVLLPLAGT